MDEAAPITKAPRRLSPLKLLAAALAGGIGAFGVPVAAHIRPAAAPVTSAAVTGEAAADTIRE